MQPKSRSAVLSLAGGADKIGTPRMNPSGPRQLRDTANEMLDAFIKAVEQNYSDRPVAAADLRRLAEALKSSAEFDAVYEKAYGELQVQAVAQALAVAHDAQRVEMFHRVVTHPLDPLLDSETISREALPNFFHFMRLVLGEEVDAFQQRCVEAHDDLKAKLGDDFNWDVFYADARTKLVLYEVLLRIAEAFRRFDMRKEWFIGLMQYSPATIGVASNVFVPNPHRDKSWTFGTDEFAQMFRHLFAPVRNMTDSDRALFTSKLGTAPDQAFAALFRNLG